MARRDSHSARLFHAIVTLGLAAAGCGGEAQSSDVATKTESGGQTDASPGASDEAAADVAAGPDAGVDATNPIQLTEDPIDAAIAEDAAADVAEEIWIVPPIR
jgi:hypothetical protein